MNGFQHLPDYASAAHAYRFERTTIRRAPRRAAPSPGALRRLVATLKRRPTLRPAREAS